MIFYSRLKHNVMLFCCWDTVFSLFVFFFFFFCCFVFCCCFFFVVVVCFFCFVFRWMLQYVYFVKSVKIAIGGASVVFYSYCQCSSASWLSLTYC